MNAPLRPPPPPPHLTAPDGSPWASVVPLSEPLAALFAEADVSELMINGAGPVWVDRRGTLSRTDVCVDQPALEHLVERLVGPLGRRVDRSTPVVDARLPDGSRLHVVVPPLAVDGPYVTIRRFRRRAVDLSSFAPADHVALLTGAVQSRANIVVSGGTSSGKTTLLNALSAAIPVSERIVTIEDAAELRLDLPHVVRLEARPPSIDGPPAVEVRELVRTSLRMRPDRIIVGEVRGPEALDMVLAMNTGHDGSLSTCHANGPVDALRRLEVMIMTADLGLPLDAVRALVHAAVDLVVHVDRRADGRRRIRDIVECDPDGPGVQAIATSDVVVTAVSRGRRAPGPTEATGS